MNETISVLPSRHYLWKPDCGVATGSAPVEQYQVITSGDGSTDFRFGSSIAVSSSDPDTAIVAAKGATVNGVPDVGAAYVLEQNQGYWSEVVKLEPSDPDEDQDFGRAVAFDWGDASSWDDAFALVGSPRRDTSGKRNSGAVYLFERSGSNWQETRQIIPTDHDAGDQFGCALDVRALDGEGETNWLIVGATGKRVNGHSRAGAVYLFERGANGLWQETEQLTAFDPSASTYFGSSVALFEDAFLVGAPFAKINGNSSQGEAYLFERQTDGSWQQTKLLASDGSTRDYFGTSVAWFDANTVFAGAPQADIGSDYNQGAVYRFERQADGSWQQTQKLVSDDSEPAQLFGHTIACCYIDTTASQPIPQLVISAHKTDIRNPHGIDVGDAQPVRAGAAYLFAMDSNTNWLQVDKLTAATRANDERFGVALGAGTDTLLIGAPFETVFGKEDQGMIYAH